MKNKICNKCGKEKELSEFAFKNKKLLKYQPNCRICNRVPQIRDFICKRCKCNFQGKYKNSLYCDICKKKNRRDIQRRNRSLIEIMCKTCGNEIETKKYLYYCCDDCKKESIVKSKKLSYERHKNLN